MDDISSCPSIPRNLAEVVDAEAEACLRADLVYGRVHEGHGGHQRGVVLWWQQDLPLQMTTCKHPCKGKCRLEL